MSAQGVPTQPEAPALDIGGVLRARRSVREFRREPVELARLARIARAAYGLCASTWPAPAQGELPITVIAAARGVLGDEPGLVRFSPGGCEVTGCLDPRLAGLLIRDYADAPAIFLLCADPHRLGDGGYGSVLVRAGSAGYALWLAAIADGLQGSVYGRTSNDVTRLARQLNPRLRHLFTVAIGQEAAEPPEG